MFLFIVTWLKFQVNYKQHHEQISLIYQRLHDIEHKLKNHRHPSNRQQYHDNKHQIKRIADDLHHIDMQLQNKSIEHVNMSSPICITPLSATSSGYGSDMN